MIMYAINKKPPKLSELDMRILSALTERKSADIADIQRIIGESFKEIAESVKKLKKLGLIKESTSAPVKYSLAIPIITKQLSIRLMGLIRRSVSYWMSVMDTKLSDVFDLINKLFAYNICPDNLEYITLVKVLLEGIPSSLIEGYDELVSKHAIFAVMEDTIDIKNLPIWMRELRAGSIVFKSSGIREKLLSIPDYDIADRLTKFLENASSYLSEAFGMRGTLDISSEGTDNPALIVLHLLGYIEINEGKIKLKVPVLSNVDNSTIKKFSESFHRTLKDRINDYLREAEAIFSETIENFMDKGMIKLVSWILFSGMLLEELINLGKIPLKDQVVGGKFAKWIELTV